MGFAPPWTATRRPTVPAIDQLPRRQPPPEAPRQPTGEGTCRYVNSLPGHVAGATPVQCVAQSFLESNNRRVAEERLRLRNVRLRIANVTRPRWLVNRFNVCS